VISQTRLECLIEPQIRTRKAIIRQPSSQNNAGFTFHPVPPAAFQQPALMFAVKDESALWPAGSNRGKFRSGGAQGRRQGLKTPV